MQNKEWMVHIWGGAWNHDANPSIERDLGISEGYHYFLTEQEKNDFVRLLNIPIYKDQGIMVDVQYGVMRHKRTIFAGVFTYYNKKFPFRYDLGYEYPEDAAVFYFTKGNMSCDCNRCSIIMSQYGDDAIPELLCGDQIKLTKYSVEYE